MKSQSSTASGRFAYWVPALRFYAKAALLQSAVFWAPSLLVPPLLGVLHLRQGSIRGVLAAMAFGVGIGGAIFVGVLGTAIAYDVRRNWRQSEPTVEWNPLHFWKVFLYGGFLMFLTAAFLSHHQGPWLTLAFCGFALLSWFGARSLAVTVRLPKTRLTLGGPNRGELTHQIGQGPRRMHWGGGHLQSGFVAMEYFALILNRSFLLFITDEGLCCWKFRGVVSLMEPLFYEPVEALLDDPEMTPGSEAFEELMRRRHTYCLPYTAIRSVEFVNRQKWGMGPIPHTGRLRVRFLGHRLQREFILLGNAHGQLIRDLITSKLQRTE